MTEQSTPSDLAAWVLDHGVGLTPARQKQLAKGYRRLEAQSDIRGRAVAIYRDRAREAEAEVAEARRVADNAETPPGTAVRELIGRTREALGLPSLGSPHEPCGRGICALGHGHTGPCRC